MLFVSISFHIVILSFGLFHTVDQDTDLHVEQELERVLVQGIAILRKAMQDIVRNGGISVSRYETGCQFVWNEGTRLEDERVVLAPVLISSIPKLSMKTPWKSMLVGLRVRCEAMSAVSPYSAASALRSMT